MLLAVAFGSAARRDATSRSDVDLGLQLVESSAEQRRQLEVDLARATGGRVDAVFLEDAPPLLRFEIARDGIVLIERRPHLWADFRARSMLDWWDFAPLARRIHAASIERLRSAAADGPA